MTSSSLPPFAPLTPASAGSMLFIGKADDANCDRAVRYAQMHFSPVVVRLGRWGEKLPAELRDWEGDYVVSYLSRWIIPGWLLAKARKAAINFHPAPPAYPGVGCNNFALYDGVPEFGVTCHHMMPKVDSGAIIAVRRFPVYPEDDVASLLERTHSEQLVLYYEVMDQLRQGTGLPASSERWRRAPYTRKELEELATLRRDMSETEIARRTRATTFGEWKPRYADET